MAFYSSNSYGRRTKQTRILIYAGSALVLIVVVIACVFGYRALSKNDSGIEPRPKDIPPVNTPAEPDSVPPPEPNVSVGPDEPIPEPNPEAVELIAKAAEYIKAEPARIIEARELLNDALALSMNKDQRALVKEALSRLADEWLFSRTFFPQDRLCESYQVRSGDLLRSIGRARKVPWEILQEINDIGRPENLRAGERIKVINGPFHARIYRSTFTMDLYLQQTFVKSFPVGLGMPGRETPTGSWIVEPGGKAIRPVWRDPDTGKVYYPEDPDYPLGSRWIRLKGLEGDAVGRTGIAFHGTKDPNLIGTAGSRGCIRLHNGDAILIYNVMEPGVSHVQVVD
ncbi:MAG: L,D-transpeptidase family protein [Planctomycetota bacterium]|jgi:hypothetical protein